MTSSVDNDDSSTSGGASVSKIKQVQKTKVSRFLRLSWTNQDGLRWQWNKKGKVAAYLSSLNFTRGKDYQVISEIQHRGQKEAIISFKNKASAIKVQKKIEENKPQFVSMTFDCTELTIPKTVENNYFYEEAPTMPIIPRDTGVPRNRRAPQVILPCSIAVETDSIGGKIKAVSVTVQDKTIGLLKESTANSFARLKETLSSMTKDSNPNNVVNGFVWLFESPMAAKSFLSWCFESRDLRVFIEGAVVKVVVDVKLSPALVANIDQSNIVERSSIMDDDVNFKIQQRKSFWQEFLDDRGQSVSAALSYKVMACYLNINASPDVVHIQAEVNGKRESYLMCNKLGQFGFQNEIPDFTHISGNLFESRRFTDKLNATKVDQGLLQFFNFLDESKTFPSEQFELRTTSNHYSTAILVGLCQKQDLIERFAKTFTGSRDVMSMLSEDSDTKKKSYLRINPALNNAIEKQEKDEHPLSQMRRFFEMERTADQRHFVSVEKLLNVKQPGRVTLKNRVYLEPMKKMEMAVICDEFKHVRLDDMIFVKSVQDSKMDNLVILNWRKRPDFTYVEVLNTSSKPFVNDQNNFLLGHVVSRFELVGQQTLTLTDISSILPQTSLTDGSSGVFLPTRVDHARPKTFDYATPLEGSPEKINNTPDILSREYDYFAMTFQCQRIDKELVACVLCLQNVNNLDDSHVFGATNLSIKTNTDNIQTSVELATLGQKVFEPLIKLLENREACLIAFQIYEILQVWRKIAEAAGLWNRLENAIELASDLRWCFPKTPEFNPRQQKWHVLMEHVHRQRLSAPTDITEIALRNAKALWTILPPGDRELSVDNFARKHAVGLTSLMAVKNGCRPIIIVSDETTPSPPPSQQELTIGALETHQNQFLRGGGPSVSQIHPLLQSQQQTGPSDVNVLRNALKKIPTVLFIDIATAQLNEYPTHVKALHAFCFGTKERLKLDAIQPPENWRESDKNKYYRLNYHLGKYIPLDCNADTPRCLTAREASFELRQFIEKQARSRPIVLCTLFTGYIHNIERLLFDSGARLQHLFKGWLDLFTLACQDALQREPFKAPYQWDIPLKDMHAYYMNHDASISDSTKRLDAMQAVLAAMDGHVQGAGSDFSTNFLNAKKMPFDLGSDPNLVVHVHADYVTVNGEDVITAVALYIPEDDSSKLLLPIKPKPCFATTFLSLKPFTLTRGGELVYSFGKDKYKKCTPEAEAFDLMAKTILQSCWKKGHSGVVLMSLTQEGGIPVILRGFIENNVDVDFFKKLIGFGVVADYIKTLHNNQVQVTEDYLDAEYRKYKDSASSSDFIGIKEGNCKTMVKASDCLLKSRVSKKDWNRQSLYAFPIRHPYTNSILHQSANERGYNVFLDYFYDIALDEPCSILKGKEQVVRVKVLGQFLPRDGSEMIHMFPIYSSPMQVANSELKVIMEQPFQIQVYGLEDGEFGADTIVGRACQLDKTQDSFQARNYKCHSTPVMPATVASPAFSPSSEDEPMAGPSMSMALPDPDPSGSTDRKRKRSPSTPSKEPALFSNPDAFQLPVSAMSDKRRRRESSGDKVKSKDQPAAVPPLPVPPPPPPILSEKQRQRCESNSPPPTEDTEEQEDLPTLTVTKTDSKFQAVMRKRDPQSWLRIYPQFSDFIEASIAYCIEAEEEIRMTDELLCTLKAAEIKNTQALMTAFGPSNKLTVNKITKALGQAPRRTMLRKLSTYFGSEEEKLFFCNVCAILPLWKQASSAVDNVNDNARSNRQESRKRSRPTSEPDANAPSTSATAIEVSSESKKSKPAKPIKPVQARPEAPPEKITIAGYLKKFLESEHRMHQLTLGCVDEIGQQTKIKCPNQTVTLSPSAIIIGQELKVAEPVIVFLEMPVVVIPLSEWARVDKCSFGFIKAVRQNAIDVAFMNSNRLHHQTLDASCVKLDPGYGSLADVQPGVRMPVIMSENGQVQLCIVPNVNQTSGMYDLHLPTDLPLLSKAQFLTMFKNDVENVKITEVTAASDNSQRMLAYSKNHSSILELTLILQKDIIETFDDIEKPKQQEDLMTEIADADSGFVTQEDNLLLKIFEETGAEKSCVLIAGSLDNVTGAYAELIETSVKVEPEPENEPDTGPDPPDNPPDDRNKDNDSEPPPKKDDPTEVGKPSQSAEEQPQPGSSQGQITLKSFAAIKSEPMDEVQVVTPEPGKEPDLIELSDSDDDEAEEEEGVVSVAIKEIEEDAPPKPTFDNPNAPELRLRRQNVVKPSMIPDRSRSWKVFVTKDCQLCSKGTTVLLCQVPDMIGHDVTPSGIDITRQLISPKKKDVFMTGMEITKAFFLKPGLLLILILTKLTGGPQLSQKLPLTYVHKRNLDIVREEQGSFQGVERKSCHFLYKTADLLFGVDENNKYYIWRDSHQEVPTKSTNITVFPVPNNVKVDLVLLKDDKSGLAFMPDYIVVGSTRLLKEDFINIQDIIDYLYEPTVNLSRIPKILMKAKADLKTTAIVDIDDPQPSTSGSKRIRTPITAPEGTDRKSSSVSPTPPQPSKSQYNNKSPSAMSEAEREKYMVSKDGICRNHFIEKSCNLGTECTYSHWMPKDLDICRYFEKCTRKNCKSNHDSFGEVIVKFKSWVRKKQMGFSDLRKELSSRKEGDLREDLRNRKRRSTSRDPHDLRHTIKKEPIDPAPSSSSGDWNSKPCRFYNNGFCKNGDSCKFIHESKTGSGYVSLSSDEELSPSREVVFR